MFQISGIIVDKSGRDYSGNMENAHGLKTERIPLSLCLTLVVENTVPIGKADCASEMI